MPVSPPFSPPPASLLPKTGSAADLLRYPPLFAICIYINSVLYFLSKLANKNITICVFNNLGEMRGAADTLIPWLLVTEGCLSPRDKRHMIGI